MFHRPVVRRREHEADTDLLDAITDLRGADIELYAGEPESPVIFDKTGVVELGCNIHDQMQAFILVTDSAVTDSTNSQGEARLTLPASVLQSTDMALQVWHPHLRNSTTPAVFQIALPTTLPLTLSVDLLPQAPATSRLERLQKRFQDLE